jgi:hypothetical protein
MPSWQLFLLHSAWDQVLAPVRVTYGRAYAALFPTVVVS